MKEHSMCIFQQNRVDFICDVVYLQACNSDKLVDNNLVYFLGLKDKNNKLIKFGDILQDEFGNLLTPVVEVLNNEHVFYFKPLKHLQTKFSIGCKSAYSNTLEIVFDMESCVQNTSYELLHNILDELK